MANIKFSIIIPAYKAKFLKECIDSILAQTYNDYELIILNDASPENIESIILAYDNSRIRYYKNSVNVGAVNVVDNWNKCLEYVNGDYIICMGDDDRLLPNCLDEYNRLITEHPGMGVYHAWTEIINEESEIIDMQEPRPLWESIYSEAFFRIKGRSQFIGDFLFDVRKLKAKGGFVKRPLAWGSDDFTVLEVAKDSGIVNSQVPMFQYRINSKTITNTGNTELKIKAIKMSKTNTCLDTRPQNALDLIYWKIIKDNSTNNYRQSITDNVATDISTHNIFRIFFWFRKINYLEITYKDLLLSFFLGMKRKLYK